MTDTAPADRWVLTLYVNGGSAYSTQAIEAVRRLCDEELDGHVDLEVIDVRQHPDLVVSDQIVAVPTLVLNAKNDPFVPRESLPRPDEVSRDVLLVQPEHGGHVGFLTGSFPGRLDSRAVGHDAANEVGDLDGPCP